MDENIAFLVENSLVVHRSHSTVTGSLQVFNYFGKLDTVTM